MRYSSRTRPAYVSADTLASTAIGLAAGAVASRFGSARQQRVTYEVDVNTWMTAVPSAFIMLVLTVSAVGSTARRALNPDLTSALRKE